MEDHNLNPKKSLADMLDPGDEGKETCIHCGRIWYEIHYKDGVCPGCQEKQLPGRTAIARKARRANVLIELAITAIVIFLIYLAMS